MSIQRINRIKEIFAKAKENWKPSLHLLTDDDLDDLEGIIKSDNLFFLSIDKAMQRGFIVPENQELILTELIKFYKQWKKPN